MPCAATLASPKTSSDTVVVDYGYALVCGRMGTDNYCIHHSLFGVRAAGNPAYNDYRDSNTGNIAITTDIQDENDEGAIIN